MTEDLQQQIDRLSETVSLLKQRFEYQRKITQFLIDIHESPNPDFVPLEDLTDD